MCMLCFTYTQSPELPSESPSQVSPPGKQILSAAQPSPQNHLPGISLEWRCGIRALGDIPKGAPMYPLSYAKPPPNTTKRQYIYIRSRQKTQTVGLTGKESKGSTAKADALLIFTRCTRHRCKGWRHFTLHRSTRLTPLETAHASLSTGRALLAPVAVRRARKSS